MKPASPRYLLSFAALFALACGGAQPSAPQSAASPASGSAAAQLHLESPPPPNSERPANGTHRNAGPRPDGDGVLDQPGSSAPPSGGAQANGAGSAGGASNAVSLDQLEARIAQDRSSSFGNATTSCAEVERSTRSICEAAHLVCQLDREQHCQRASTQCTEVTAQCQSRCSRCE